VSRSLELGEENEVRLDAGTIRYRERGVGAPMVFVHPLLTNGDIWRKVVPRLSADRRCITPDWPLGGHDIAVDRDADLSPRGLAKMIADFLTALVLEDVTLVGNNTGGGLCQIVATKYPERIARLVLTDCDAYDNFPPPAALPLVWGAYVPGLLYMLAQSMRMAPLRRLPIAFGWLTKRPIDREIVVDSYLGPFLRDSRVRRDGLKVIKGVSPKYTLAAARKFGEFEQPVLVAWSPEDRIFPWKYAERLAKAFPNAKLETIEDSYTFVSEDQPERLAQLITAFTHETASLGAEGSQEAAQ